MLAIKNFNGAKRGTVVRLKKGDDVSSYKKHILDWLKEEGVVGSKKEVKDE